MRKHCDSHHLHNKCIMNMFVQLDYAAEVGNTYYFGSPTCGEACSFQCVEIESSRLYYARC